MSSAATRTVNDAGWAIMWNDCREDEIYRKYFCFSMNYLCDKLVCYMLRSSCLKLEIWMLFIYIVHYIHTKPPLCDKSSQHIVTYLHLWPTLWLVLQLTKLKVQWFNERWKTSLYKFLGYYEVFFLSFVYCKLTLFLNYHSLGNWDFI